MTQPEPHRTDISSTPPWHGADAERRRVAALRSPVAAGGRSGAAGALSLDNRTYVSPGPHGDGEWHVQQTSVDDYAEFLAVEDGDRSLLRRVGEGTSVEKLEEVVEDSMSERWERNLVAARRAKRNLKWKVLMLRGDRLWTLTTRGGIANWDEAWKLWGQFERYCSRRFKAFKVVVVMERHKSGFFHIHFVSNCFFDVGSMRLWWHRILVGEKLAAPLRGDMSPGNVDVSRVLRSRRLSSYLSKYLSKGFESMWDRRIKRFASSKGIGEPTRSRCRMHASMGEQVYRLRRLAEADGWRVETFFEGVIAGRRLVWLQCKRLRR